MAEIGSTFYDLIDLHKSTDGNNQIAQVIEMLAEQNPILEDAVTVECNKGTTHLTTVRTGLPSNTWGRLYKGVEQSKSAKASVEDTTGFLEAYSSVDKRLLDLAGSKAPAIRLDEASAHIEAMNQTMSSTLFYGNTDINPDRFMGLAPRFSDLSAPNGKNIIDAGGTGNDLTSVWFVTWGSNTCSMLHPKNIPAGLMREDKGEQRVEDENGNPYYAKEEMFTWHNGLSVRDWRYVVRIANIDVSELRAGNVDIYRFMRSAFYQHEGRRNSMGKNCIYANRDVMEALDAIGTNSGSNDNFIRLTPMEIQGKQVLSYRGIPIREVDALLNTEDRVQ